MTAAAGTVGFGNFGQFLAERLARQGHEVLATSCTDYAEAATALGVRFFRDADDFVEEVRRPSARAACLAQPLAVAHFTSSVRTRSNRTW